MGFKFKTQTRLELDCFKVWQSQTVLNILFWPLLMIFVSTLLIFFLAWVKMTQALVCFSSFLHIFMISQSPDFCLISSCIFSVQWNYYDKWDTTYGYYNSYHQFVCSVPIGKSIKLLPKLFWPTVRKNCSSDLEKLLKFKAEGREFAKLLRSLSETVKGQKIFW